MANLLTTTDLVQYVEAGMGELTNGSSPFRAKILTQCVRTNRELHAGGFSLNPDLGKPVMFPWAVSQYPKVQNFEAPISAGTVDVTNNSTSINLSSAPASSVANYYIRVSGRMEVYRIATHTGGNNAATLDAAYVGDNATGASYEIFRLRYDYGSDVLSLITPVRIYSSDLQVPYYEIDVIDKLSMDRQWPLALMEKRFPSVCAIVYQNTGTQSLQFNAYPNALARMEVDYIASPPVLDLVGSNPIMPEHHRITIAEWALYYMLREVDDDRSPTQLAIAKNSLDAMIAEYEGLNKGSSRDRGRVIPRSDMVVAERRVMRTTDGFLIG